MFVVAPSPGNSSALRREASVKQRLPRATHTTEHGACSQYLMQKALVVSVYCNTMRETRTKLQWIQGLMKGQTTCSRDTCKMASVQRRFRPTKSPFPGCGNPILFPFPVQHQADFQSLLPCLLNWDPPPLSRCAGLEPLDSPVDPPPLPVVRAWSLLTHL